MGRQVLTGLLIIGALSAESGLLVLNRLILSGTIFSHATHTKQCTLTF